VIQMRPVPTDPSPTSHIRRCFVSRNVGLLTRTFVMYVRPLLEYNSVIWSLSLKRDVALVKQVQRRFTKGLPGLNNHSYDERLKLLNLERLELRRIWSDLLWCYKIVFGLVHVNEGIFHVSPEQYTRLQTSKHFNSCSERSTHFSERVVNVWNRLSLRQNLFRDYAAATRAAE